MITILLQNLSKTNIQTDSYTMRIHMKRYLLLATFLCTTTVIQAIDRREIKEYVLITEDCPIHTNFHFMPKQDRLILITKIVHKELTPSQKALLTRSLS